MNNVMADTGRFLTHVAVFVVLCDTQGRVLLQQRSGTGYLDGYWDLPSGHVEQDEALPAAAARELFEETGVTVAPADLRLLTIDQYFVERNYLNFVFAAHAWQGTPTVQEPDKCSAMGWFAPAALPERCTNGVWVAARQGFAGDLQFTVTDRPAYRKMIDI